MFYGVFLFSIFFGSFAFSSPPEPKLECHSTREYVTALRYLRDHQEFALNEPDARKIADQVSNGCTGSANRFIKVNELLVRAGLSADDALRNAIVFAGLNDEQSDSFSRIFRAAFAKDELDLDIRQATLIALELSKDFKGDPKRAERDFVTLSKFCAGTEGPALKGYRCARLAADLAQLTELYDSSVARPFLKLFEFLQSKNGPSLPSSESLTTAREIIQFGPLATKNYTLGYRFALSKDGLALDRKSAHDFAKNMAKKTEFKPKTRTETGSRAP